MQIEFKDRLKVQVVLEMMHNQMCAAAAIELNKLSKAAAEDSGFDREALFAAYITLYPDYL